ncbi:MFS transporter [Paractinoplanes brasiliensis]|uniref:EmrB/QacA subfamily drug resistance transporter n=1 Tax=Paractinoplanes brasiliensis TaxID=52695 RepID=A0A4R6JZI2_9ACTN|nr:MFS transporter [Actinoplanes brasiliensis]TDO41837.1 EmrB/QacA subfamily drug resistance transporter [Actinoplanes brasiliensis]GID29886.1 MFS transporter [Actinoplanes brasiliensis]
MSTTKADHTQVTQQPPVPPHRAWALLVLCVSLLIVTLDNTILNVALPTLVRDLHATSSQLQWVVDGYALVFGGLLLVAGSLADRYGRKRAVLLGLCLFAVASAWAAWSSSVHTLIAARASMGVGAALIMPATLSIITDMFREPAARQRAIGAWAATSGLGIAIGPIAAGLLLAHFWWGSVFLVNVPIAALGFACALLLVPDSRNPVPRRADPVGAALSIAGLGLLLWAIIEAPTDGWGSGRVLGAGLGGLVVLALFVVWENASSHPMLSLSFFRSRRFSVATSAAGLNTFALFGAMFVLTQFLQFTLGYSALAAGVRILPVASVLAVAAPASAQLVRLIGTKLVVAAGLTAVAGGLWQLSTATTNSSYGDVLPGMILLGLGAGLVMPATAESVMGSLPPGRTGVGAATNGTSLQVGGALGVAVVGSLLNTRYQDQISTALAPYHLPGDVTATVHGSIGGALEVAARLGGEAGHLLTAAARSAFMDGMHLGLLTAAGVAAAGILLTAIALPARPPEKQTPASTDQHTLASPAQAPEDHTED